MKKGISSVSLKVISWQLCLAMILSVLVFTPFNVSAATRSGNTDFMNGKYGIFLHYLPAGGSSDQDWINKVKSCDTSAVAAAAESAGASWVTLTLTQADGRYCIPIDTIFANSSIPGFGSGTTKAVGVAAEDDLVNRLYNSLSAKNIKLMLYWIPGAPSSNDALAATMGATQKVGGNWYLNDASYQNQAAAMQVVSNYYGAKISGWWVDGCYDSVGFNQTVATAEAAALKSGNADAVIAFNNGTQYDDCRFDSEDYSAGEICHPATLSTTNIYDYSANGRWTENGYQKHYLTFLGPNWGTAGAYYNTEDLVKHCYDNILSKGAAISFDVSCSSNGTIDAAQLSQLQALKSYYATSGINLPITFESGLHESFFYQDIENASIIENKEVEMATGEFALNGDYSMVVKPTHNLRVDITAQRKISGNPDFSMTDFSKVTGIMMRVKLIGCIAGKTYKTYALLSQTGKSTTWLTNGAKLYDATGKLISTMGTVPEGFQLPANFDGFIFMPLESARNQRVPVTNTYGNYQIDADNMVNLANPYSFTLSISGIPNATITLDDISYYSGHENGDAWDAMRSLGYDVRYSRQPEIYTLPLDFENYELPENWDSLTRIYYSNGSYPQESVGGCLSLVDGAQALGGDMSLKFSMPAPTAQYITTGNDGLRVTTTGAMPVQGIAALSKDKVAAAALAANDDYAYLAMRIKLPTSGSAYSLCLKVNQGDITNANICAGAIAYTVGGTNVTVTSDLNGVSIPSGFDGYLYFPITKLNSGPDLYIQYNTTYEEALSILPDLSQPFSIALKMSGDNWSNMDFYVDDISFITGTGGLPLNFDTALQHSFTSLTNSGSSISGISYAGSDTALNGNGSFKINFPATVSSNLLTNSVAIDGNPDFSWTNLQSGTQKVDGIMLRMKTTGTIAGTAFTMAIEQNGKNKTWIGRNAVAYDLNGTLLTTGAVNFSSVIPANFDGYLFLPFNAARVEANGWQSYSATGDLSSFVNLSSNYKMSLYFGNPFGTDKVWSGATVMIDDITYYKANSTNDYYNAIRSLGYEMINAEQPSVYTLPINFESYQLPFANMTSYCSNDGSVKANGVNSLVGKNEALVDNVSQKISVPASTTGVFIRAESSWSNFSGIDGLDKTTLKYANTGYATFRFRIKAPASENNLPYHINFSVTQNGSSANELNTGYLATGAHGYNLNGTYNINVSSWDRYIVIPSNFDGYVEVPVWKVFAATSSAYISYKDEGNQLPNLSQNFAVRLNTYSAGTGVNASASTAGVTFLLDDISMKTNGKLGDINNDGSVNANDLISMRHAILGIINVNQNTMDLTGDGQVNITDLVRLKKLFAALSA